jgi:hypothetical protein
VCEHPLIRPKKGPGPKAEAGKPYRCHHAKAPAQGGKAGDDNLAAIIRKALYQKIFG